MTIQRNVSLTAYSTMRLGGEAAYLTEAFSRDDIRVAHDWAGAHSLPLLVIGNGSNIIWRDEGFRGLVIVNRLAGYEVTDVDDVNVYVRAGAGEIWDDIVARSAANALTGIEGMSLVPGTVGATPVQNVGAYGQDVSQTIVSLEAYDTAQRLFVTIAAAECGFGYRTSRFKTTDHGRFIITAVTFHLRRANPQPPFYASLAGYFDAHGIEDVTPQTMREAVIAIRQSKLPDPARVANTGSFFANPIIALSDFVALQAAHPSMPHWPTDQPDKVKIPAGWLIEQAGLRGIHDAATGMATWPQQALVIVNEHATTTAQLLTFRQHIIDTVRTAFGITLEQEPELLP